MFFVVSLITRKLQDVFLHHCRVDYGSEGQDAKKSSGSSGDF